MANYLEILCGIIALFLAIYYYYQLRFKFWKNRGVIGPRPILFFGNLTKVLLGKLTVSEYVKEIYETYKNEPLVGVYVQGSPVLIVNDPDIIKDILIRDFSIFSDRGFTVHERTEPLTANLLNLEVKRWRPLRTKLSPMFSSGKLKGMLDLILESASHLEKYLDKIVAEKKPVNLHNVIAKFTIDVIGSCAFGIEMNADYDVETEFHKTGNKITVVDLENTLRLKIRTYVPKLYDLLGFIFPDKRFTPFFSNLLGDTIKYRRENNVYRPDFVHMLMELEEHSDKIENIKLTNIFLTAQAFIFFVAGFETSSTTITNTLYELARNHEIQDKLRAEIREHYTKHNGKLTYEDLNNMEYLDKVFKETLRMYPVAGVLPRKSVAEYTFRDTKVTIPKDLLLWIPTLAFQRDPEIYPNPTVFNPENFSEEAVAARHPMHYLPFGDGPRNCIGARFAIYQSKIGLITILRNHKVDVCEETVIPFKFDPNAFLLSPKETIYLKITKLEN